MKYVGRLILLAQAVLMAASVDALTLNGVTTITVNGISCGSATGNVVSLGSDGALSVNTSDSAACAPGGGTPTGPYTLIVTTSGSGTISKNPAATSYDAGTSVELTATANEGSSFSSWGGACLGNTPTCTVDMTTNKTVTATFTSTSGGGGTECVSGNGLICKTATTWPVIPQSFLTGSTSTAFSMKYSEVLAVKVSTTAAGAVGTVTTSYTSSGQATRRVALSTIPGDFPPATINGVVNPCVRTGLSSTKNLWRQGGEDATRCILPPNSTAYINVKFENCAVGGTCKFFLSNQ